MCTALPPQSPPQPPKYVPKDPPTPPKPTVHGPYSAKTLQLIRENHGGGVQYFVGDYFVDGVLNRRAMYQFAVEQPKKNPLRMWQEGMRISRSHFLTRDEEHAAAVLEILCATPKPPRIPKPAPQPVPRRPLPSPASDQLTVTQYSKHRRSSLLPLAPAPKRPCPTPPFQFRALRQVCTERLLHIGHSFIFNLPLEARKCVLGLDRRVSGPDIRVGPAPTPTRSSVTPIAGRRAAAVRPRSPATAPRPRSSFLSVPTHYGPLSRRSSPLVPRHSAPTRVVVPLITHPLRAAEAQQFALGPRPQRPY